MRQITYPNRVKEVAQSKGLSTNKLYLACRNLCLIDPLHFSMVSLCTIEKIYAQRCRPRKEAALLIATTLGEDNIESIFTSGIYYPKEQLPVRQIDKRIGKWKCNLQEILFSQKMTFENLYSVLLEFENLNPKKYKACSLSSLEEYAKGAKRPRKIFGITIADALGTSLEILFPDGVYDINEVKKQTKANKIEVKNNEI